VICFGQGRFTVLGALAERRTECFPAVGRIHHEVSVARIESDEYSGWYFDVADPGDQRDPA
jgi:hypothetical protein